MLKACTAAVLIGVVCLDSRAGLSIVNVNVNVNNLVPGAWSVSCVG